MNFQIFIVLWRSKEDLLESMTHYVQHSKVHLRSKLFVDGEIWWA